MPLYSGMISIIVPVLNEEKALDRQLKRFRGLNMRISFRPLLNRDPANFAEIYRDVR